MVTAAQAQDSNRIGLTINPALSERVVTAGQLTLTTIDVTNISQQPQAVSVSFRPIAPIDPVTDESARSRYDATSWLSVDSRQFLLAPGESRPISLRINPPDDAGPGGHYANVVFRVLNDQNTSDSQSSARISPELSTVLFMTVPGNITESAQVDFTSPPTWNWSKNQEFNAAINNTGNIHLLPSGSVSISQLNGHEVEHLDFPAKLIIPGTSSSLVSEWTNPGPGLYRANFQIGYGSPLQFVNNTSHIIVILPAIWIQTIFLLMVLALIRWGGPPLLRRFKRRRVQFGYDLSGEPHLMMSREQVEQAANNTKLKDVSRKR